VVAGSLPRFLRRHQYHVLQQFFKKWAREKDLPDPMAGSIRAG